MPLRRSFRLIPRNNWDYGWTSMMVALRAIASRRDAAPNIEERIGLPPVFTGSGRASLFALLKALGLPPGSPVGVPLFCCSVVFEAIKQAGCVPRFIDSGSGDFNLSPEDLLRKRDGLAAVVAVHMFGNPCDMDALVPIANGIPVLEDCAQALFSRYKGVPAGLLADAAFYSFRCGKYLSSGEGSAIVCKDPRLLARVRDIVGSWAAWSRASIFAHGLGTYVKATLYHRPWYGLLGYPIGMRLDKTLNLTAKEGFQAKRIAPSDLALAEKRISGLSAQIDRQSRNAGLLRSLLAGSSLRPPDENEDGVSNWSQFPLRFDDTSLRDRMAGHLLSRGIDTAKYLDDIADAAAQDYGYRGDCPVAERLSKTTLLVPIHYTLADKDIRWIGKSLLEGPGA